MEDLEDDTVPFEEDIYAVDDSLSPIDAILKYGKSNLVSQQLAYIRGIPVAAIQVACINELEALVQLGHELGTIEEILYNSAFWEYLRQVPYLGAVITSSELFKLEGDHKRAATLLDELASLSVTALQAIVSSGKEVTRDHALTAISALEALLPFMQSMEAAGGWKLLNQQVQWLQEQLSQQVTSRDPMGAAAAAGDCASCLLELVEKGTRALQSMSSSSSSSCSAHSGRDACVDDVTQEGHVDGQRIGCLIADALDLTCRSPSAAVQEVAASKLPVLLPLLETGTQAAEVGEKLMLHLVGSSMWRVRQAAAKALPALIQALMAWRTREPHGFVTGPVTSRSAYECGTTSNTPSSISSPETAIHNLLNLFIDTLAKDPSMWVRSAALCAAGPLLCNLVQKPRPVNNPDSPYINPQLGTDLSTCQPDDNQDCQEDERMRVPETAHLAGAHLYLSYLPHLSALYVDAVLSPRTPEVEAFKGLAECLAEVACCVVPHTFTWEESRLHEVYCTFLKACPEVACAVIAVLPELVSIVRRQSVLPSVIVDPLLEAVRERPADLGPAMASSLLPLAQSLPNGSSGRNLLLPLLPILSSASVNYAGASEQDAVVVPVLHCGKWRMRLVLAKALTGLAKSFSEDMSKDSECNHAVVEVLHCASILQHDPVWSVRKAAKAVPLIYKIRLST
ncbi:hypothetical protein CEUSTIGMA_g10444.t1 [Chlamydomonas eustigma]|uniref:Uncharacterized protein n=1 Tax=Chlamydomonas eustigma TaxID=1157962 RepID=A0A250XIW2_9CHLO|nr:hypothetical protein CEUSTIGMA_g10444.t1 [Chlamydomonas eustigma]|eukprot:GAX83017.1 hypothetical protein CEUSTIGMA_g10444.t1 [Chlamydomonas eustigma]